MSTAKVEQETTSVQQKHNIRWTIKNWDVVCPPGYCIESEPLALTQEATGQPNLTWILKFFPRGLEGSDNPTLALELLPLSPTQLVSDAKIHFEWVAHTHKHIEDQHYTYVGHFNSGLTTVDGSAGGVWKRQIGGLGSAFQNICTTSSVSSCTVDSRASGRALPQFSPSSGGNFSLTVSNCQSLADNLSAAVFDSPASEPLVDLKVTYGDGETLQVMKSILQVRSPVFRAMFSGQFLEQQTNELMLDDCADKAAVTAFFRYLHSGSLSLHNSAGLRSTLKELLYLADKYCVKCLLQDLQKCLLDNFAIMREHLVFLSELAYLHSLDDLKARCVQLARMGVFPDKEDRAEVEAFKAVVTCHVQLVWDMLGLD